MKDNVQRYNSKKVEKEKEKELTANEIYELR